MTAVEKEEAANYFALALLMPKKEYEMQVKKHTDGNLVNTKAIADYFHVSISDAHLRGVHLGILRLF